MCQPRSPTPPVLRLAGLQVSRGDEARRAVLPDLHFVVRAARVVGSMGMTPRIDI